MKLSVMMGGIPLRYNRPFHYTDLVVPPEVSVIRGGLTVLIYGNSHACIKDLEFPEYTDDICADFFSELFAEFLFHNRNTALIGRGSNSAHL